METADSKYHKTIIMPDGTIIATDYGSGGIVTTSIYLPNSRGVLMADGEFFPRSRSKLEKTCEESSK